MLDLFSAIMGLAFFFSGLAGVSSVLYIHLKYRGYIEKKVTGINEGYYGLWIGIMNIGMQGHYLIFRERARRDKVDEIYQALPIPLKRAVLTAYFSFGITFICMVAGSTFTLLLE